MVDDGASVLAMTTNDLDVHPEQLLARVLGAAGATSAEARGSADLLGGVTDAKAGGFSVEVDRPRLRQPLNAMLDHSKRLDEALATRRRSSRSQTTSLRLA